MRLDVLGTRAYVVRSLVLLSLVEVLYLILVCDLICVC
jgi:hypothetical protein